METYPPITLLLIVVNILFSYRGFNNIGFFSRYAFDTQRIWLYREYDRFISSGFLHVDWKHLIFNMLTLWFFGRVMEPYLGTWSYLLVYFGSLIGGGLLALLLHGKRSGYLAVGASGAVCGLVFSYIAINPDGYIGIFIYLPAWLYGLLYLLYTIYGIRSRADNVGHEAHLGGALTGLLFTVLLDIELLRWNWPAILTLFVVISGFLYITVRHPHLLVLGAFGLRSRGYRTIDDDYNERKKTDAQNLDRILEKIHRRGVNSLTKEERAFLEKHKK